MSITSLTDAKLFHFSCELRYTYGGDRWYGNFDNLVSNLGQFFVSSRSEDHVHIGGEAL